jgi:hypothetical protein
MVTKTMARKLRYTPQQVITALQYTRGMQYLAARKLGCSHETVRTYLNRFPEIQAALDLERGEMVDLAELKLWEALENGQPWAISLCLRTVGKARGYVERNELTGKDGEAIGLHLQVQQTAQEVQARLAERLKLFEEPPPTLPEPEPLALPPPAAEDVA